MIDGFAFLSLCKKTKNHFHRKKFRKAQTRGREELIHISNFSVKTYDFILKQHYWATNSVTLHFGALFVNYEMVHYKTDSRSTPTVY